jgi:hypothetical protein
MAAVGAAPFGSSAGAWPSSQVVPHLALFDGATHLLKAPTLWYLPQP